MGQQAEPLKLNLRFATKGCVRWSNGHLLCIKVYDVPFITFHGLMRPSVVAVTVMSEEADFNLQ